MSIFHISVKVINTPAQNTGIFSYVFFAAGANVVARPFLEAKYHHHNPFENTTRQWE
jgi:hypothetical protein